MNTYIFDSQGNPLKEYNSNSPILNIVWAKAFDEIYCHHAYLTFSFIPGELLFNEYFKISVGIRQQTIEKGKVKNFTDKVVSAHIPGIYNDGKITIPLNSVKILDSLCENGWTSLKNGERGTTKSFPLYISIDHDNTNPFEYSFQHSEGKFPFTICENEFNKLNNDEKLETIIVLK